MHKIEKSGGFLGRLLGPLLKTGFPFTKNVLKALTKKYLNTIRINSSSISNRCSYSKINFGSGMTTLIISNEEMNDIMKIVKSLEESGLLIKDISNQK